MFDVKIAERFYACGTPEYQGWFYNTMVHRVNGPAIQRWLDNGALDYQLYSLYGVEITEKIKEWASTVGIPDLYQMSNEETVIFKMVWR